MEAATKEAIDEAEKFLASLKDELRGPGKKKKKEKKVPKMTLKPRAAVEIYDDASPDATPRAQFRAPSSSDLGVTRSLDATSHYNNGFMSPAPSAKGKSRGGLKSSGSLPSISAQKRGLRKGNNEISRSQSAANQEHSRSQLINNVNAVLNETHGQADEEFESLEFTNQIKDEINEALGVGDTSSDSGLIAPDGRFKPQLRATIQNTLLTSRFDNVATVLADAGWADKNDEIFDRNAYGYSDDEEIENQQPILSPKKGITPSMANIQKKLDITRKPFVSVLKKAAIEGSSKRSSRTASRANTADKRLTTASDVPSNYTLCEVSHPGLEGTTHPNSQQESRAATPGSFTKGFDPTEMCFGCWSAGVKRKCTIHEDSKAKVKTSQTMLLCRNWDLGVMRRRYRSEEIQEIFLKKSASLRYDAKRKKFTTVAEQRHPVYRTVTNLLTKFNTRILLFIKIRRWLYSMADTVCMGKVKNAKTVAKSLEMKAKRSINNQYKLNRYARKVKYNLPKAPVTGTSFPELTGKVIHLCKHNDMSTGTEVDLIVADPIPKPLKLYDPREYEMSVPKSIPMPSSSKIAESSSSNVVPTEGPVATKHFEFDHPASWIESLSSSMCDFSVKNARMQISAVTPMKGLELLRRTKQPPPSTIKFATLSRKPCPGNICVGGLAVELLVYQLINTFFPSQYGNLLATEQGIVSPGISPEISLVFQSLLSGPVVQPYILRPVEHPLNYRRSPTITVCSLIEPTCRNYYGENRPEQTGEQEAHGFRTSAWTYHLYPLENTDALVFTPGPEVVSLNGTGANRSQTTHADFTYPFCEPSTKDNSTLDFYHLLLTGYISANKAQVFTALTCQEPGQFQKACQDGPMGHMVVSVYRSWAFTQKDTIQEFKTDDGIPYWYHHRTGQTFWERPLYDEEKVSALDGGLILDMEHNEEPLLCHRGQEGAERRYLQGEFRKQMLTHHETMREAAKRRKAANMSAGVARDRGLLPEGVTESQLLDAASRAGIAADSSYGNGDVVDNGRIGASENYSVATTGAPSTANDYSVVKLDRITTAPGEFPSGSNIDSGKRPDSANISIGSHESSESCLVNDQGKQRPMRPPSQQAKNISHSNSQGRLGSLLENVDEGLNDSQMINQQSIASDDEVPFGKGMQGVPGFQVPAGATAGGLDPNMIAALTSVLGKMMGNMVDAASPQEMLQMGLGMGVALMQSNPVKDLVVTTTAAPERDEMKKRAQMTFEDFQNEEVDIEKPSKYQLNANGEMLMVPNMEAYQVEENPEQAHRQSQFDPNVHPIGAAQATQELRSKKPLDHTEEIAANTKNNELVNVPLNAYENAREVKIHYAAPTETPDVAPPKHLTDCYSMTRDEALREKFPVMVYPELSSHTEGGAPLEATKHPAAGVGTSFVKKEDGDKQIMVKGSAVLRKAVMPLPVGFAEAITAKHVASQTVDYLPQVPNLPQSRTVGRVKPRSAAVDWLAVNFDPWSAGKNPLSTEFVNSLATKAEILFDKEEGAAKALEAMEELREAAGSEAIVDVKDAAGLAAQRGEVSKAQMLLADFKKVCSLARHSKVSEVEQLMNQPDWNVPIDYQDEHGNGLIHVVAQNGNKRLIKMCLRRGANLDLQNLNGNTALHFLFAYDHEEVGNYLVKKGADNSIRNRDGLTCYEGLSAKELELL